jgi:SAM-dependent methyltransferase
LLQHRASDARVLAWRHMTVTKAILNTAHHVFIFARRVRILAEHLASEFPQNARALDIGAGDGSISHAIMALRPDVVIDGIEVLVRPKTHIPVHLFDGVHIPFDDNSFDIAILVDVLHHVENPLILLREAARVARRYVVIKDHLREGFFAELTLRLMDWIGNVSHEVVLQYNYLTESEWRCLFSQADLEVDHWSGDLGLYPFPFSLIFERRLHMISRLAVLSKKSVRP